MKLNYVRGDRYLRQGMPSQLEKKILYRNNENIRKKKKKKNLSPDEQIKMNDFLTLGGEDGGVYIACLKATVYKFPSLREHTDGNVPLNPSLK